MLGLPEQTVSGDLARVPPMIGLGFFFKINPKSNSDRHPVARSHIFIHGLGTSGVLGLPEQTMSGGPVRVSPIVGLGFFFVINSKFNSGRHPVARSTIFLHSSGTSGVLDLIR